MKLVEFNWTPTDRQLRQFAGICLVALPLIGWLWGAGGPVMWGLSIAGLVMAIAGWIRPAVIRPVFLALMIVAMPIGLIVGELMLLTVYFGVVWPLGMLQRVLKRDPLQLKMDRSAESYWRPKQQPRGPRDYYRQF